MAWPGHAREEASRNEAADFGTHVLGILGIIAAGVASVSRLDLSPKLLLAPLENEAAPARLLIPANTC